MLYRLSLREGVLVEVGPLESLLMLMESEDERRGIWGKDRDDDVLLLRAMAHFLAVKGPDKFNSSMLMLLLNLLSTQNRRSVFKVRLRGFGLAVSC